jgi:hypothetical protein
MLIVKELDRLTWRLCPASWRLEKPPGGRVRGRSESKRNFLDMP